jgi:choline dehydrogenase-like flavoprotein
MGAVTEPALERGAVTKQDRRLRAFLWFIAVLSFFFILDYLRGGLWGDEHFRFVANSVAKDALFVAVAAIGAANVRRYASLCVPLLVLGHGALIVANGLMLFTDQDPVETFGTEIPATAFALAWMAADAVIVAVLLVLHRAAQRERLGLSYLSPLEFATLRALADVLVHGERETVSAHRIALNVDDYLSRLDAPGKRNVRRAYLGLSLYPLTRLRPPFALMAPASRYAFVERRFVRAVGERRVWRPLRPLVAAMIRSAQQFVFLGYYGDEKSHASVGYEVFSERGVEVPPRPPSPTVEPIEPPAGGALRADVVVIGSGAAGAILAHRLAARGRRVLVLERGPHVTPDRISEREVDMYLELYNEGALQMSTDFRFQVLQAMCVGGTTVVNNAICFRAPDAVLGDWNERHRAGLDLDALAASYARVEQRLSVQEAPEDRATPGWHKLAQGIDALGLPGTFGRLRVNIDDCVGCGYCNIGCMHGRKLSMLDTYLPDAEDQGAQILANCRVTGIESTNGRVDGVHCEVEGHGPLRIRARTVVVAAGAVNSSHLLLRSGIKRGLAGRNLQFNIVSPLAARFDGEVRAFAGLQMSHYYEPPGSDYLIETWFNPPATQALVMPGWFRRHFDNMLGYSHTACAGVVVGTTGPATVRGSGRTPQIRYRPAAADLRRLVTGLKQLGEIYLAAGARRVMPATYLEHEITSPRDLGQLDQYARDNEGLSLNSAHPQGGNPISDDWQRGVVDPSFRVHGKRNLYVCDASVFPGSVGVNPQLTVMALADYAGERIG